MKALLPSRNGDLNTGRADELCHTHGGACGTRFREKLRIDRVHALKQFHISEIDLNSDGVFEAHSGLFENYADVLQTRLYLGFELGWILVRLQVAADLAGDEKRSAGEDARREGSALGKLFRLNGFLLRVEGSDRASGHEK